ncbi:tyrosine-type recombinase/integrase [Lysinibacillus sp. NPDC094177]|uniref:tyrosine-type recombinase/integrase n=1 Tax=Lysinibacillus sp. NPDC094177 TaxID=3390580 RepID=UPI003D03D436
MGRRRGELSLEEKILTRIQITDEEAFGKFEKECHLKNLRPATIQYYRSELSSIQKTMIELNLNKQMVELTNNDVEQIILHLKEQIKTVSINTRLRALKSFFNFLDKKNLITKNPISDIKQLRDRQRAIETLDDKEIEKIAATIRSQNTFVGVRDITIFILMLDTGIRLSELVGIKVNDIRGSELIVRETKNLTERTVYLSKKTLQQLNVYLRLRGMLETEYLFVNVDDEQFKERGIQNRFEKYRKLANIKKQFSPHILRHTYAKRSILKGIDAFSLAALLGHSDLTVTKRYVRLWGSDLEAKAKQYSTINKLKL